MVMKTNPAKFRFPLLLPLGYNSLKPECSGTCWHQLVALTENPLGSARSKHIDVRFHFVRELLRAKKIDIQLLASEEHHADILMKSLAATPLIYHRKFWLNLPLDGE